MWDVSENLTHNLSLDEATQMTSPSTALLSSLSFIVDKFTKFMYSRNYLKRKRSLPTSYEGGGSLRLLICVLERNHKVLSCRRMRKHFLLSKKRDTH